MRGVLLVVLYSQERLRPFHGQRKGKLIELEREAALRNRRTALARGVSFRRKKSSKSLGRPTALVRLSAKQIKTIEAAQRAQERARKNFLHNTEVCSILVVVFLVWSAQYFRIEGSCSAETTGSSNLFMEQAVVCEVLGVP